MKMSDILAKINARNKYSEIAKSSADISETNINNNTLAQIYDFAALITQKAEDKFGLTEEQGDLVYFNIITALKYLKNYPKD
jgi:hypothetical protein